MAEQSLLEIDGLCKTLGVGKNTAYELLNNYEIDAFKIGTVWKIPRASVEAYIARKCKERKKVMVKIVN